MPIEIRVEGAGRYTARATPPHAKGRIVVIDQPSYADEIIEVLDRAGCHATDVADAFNAADPSWLSSGE
jgi:hypothetical protein